MLKRTNHKMMYHCGEYGTAYIVKYFIDNHFNAKHSNRPFIPIDAKHSNRPFIPKIEKSSEANKLPIMNTTAHNDSAVIAQQHDNEHAVSTSFTQNLYGYYDYANSFMNAAYAQLNLRVQGVVYTVNSYSNSAINMASASINWLKEAFSSVEVKPIDQQHGEQLNAQNGALVAFHAGHHHLIGLKNQLSFKMDSAVFERIANMIKAGQLSIKENRQKTTQDAPIFNFVFRLDAQTEISTNAMFDNGRLQFDGIFEMNIMPSSRQTRHQDLDADHVAGLRISSRFEQRATNNRVEVLADEDETPVNTQQLQEDNSPGATNQTKAPSANDSVCELKKTTANILHTSKTGYAFMGIGVALAVAGACIAAIASLPVGLPVASVGLLVASYGLFKQIRAEQKPATSNDFDMANDMSDNLHSAV